MWLQHHDGGQSRDDQSDNVQKRKGTEKGDIQIKEKVLPHPFPLPNLTKVELSGAHTLQLHTYRMA